MTAVKRKPASTTYNGMTLTGETLTQVGDNTLGDLMVCCRGNQTLVAKVLGVNRSTIRNTLKEGTITIIRDGVLYKSCGRPRLDKKVK